MNAPWRESSEPTAAVSDAIDPDDVVRRAQAGDVDAFEAIYRVHAPAILALCRRMAGDEHEARELLQDVFVRAWERLATFRGQSALATWLHRLGVNVVLNRLRGSRRDANRMITGDDETFGTRSTTGAMDARMDLDAALVHLPAGARAVFVLHDVEGYSHDEISQMMGIAPGTARTQLFRARRALMKLLDQ
jgi:RNA polymerase sigma-70 factor, ECF subfamily